MIETHVLLLNDQDVAFGERRGEFNKTLIYRVGCKGHSFPINPTLKFDARKCKVNVVHHTMCFVNCGSDKLQFYNIAKQMQLPGVAIVTKFCRQILRVSIAYVPAARLETRSMTGLRPKTET